jgi:hypothetical protein
MLYFQLAQVEKLQWSTIWGADTVMVSESLADPFLPVVMLRGRSLVA